MRRYLIIILLLLSAVIHAQTTYYVSEGGGGDTLATIAEVNALSLGAGDSVLFKRGDTFRGSVGNTTSDGGSAVADLVYSAYGSGAKPILLGSISANNTSDWNDLGGNIWSNNNASFTVDVGNLIFADGTCGIKVATSAELNAQGEFWYSFTGDSIAIYSVGNPATVYTTIECALKRNVIVAHYNDYTTYENLDIRYTGGHGISGYDNNYITIQYCDFSYIGGGDLYEDYTVRYGNAIEFYASAQHCIVRYNKINQCFDTGITAQGWEEGQIMKDIRIYYNIIENCNWTMELFHHGTDAEIDSIFFENNTCINAGANFGHNERWSAGRNAGHFVFWDYNASAQRVYVRNNIVKQDASVNNDPSTWFAVMYYSANGIILEYNLYDIDLGTLMYTGTTTEIAYKTLADFQTGVTQDAHSISGNADFITEYTNLSLQSTSDAIDAGINVGLTLDYAGNAVPYNTTPDIGAYEYGSSAPDPDPPATGGFVKSGNKFIKYNGKIVKQ
jgi:hypothetical protein